MPSLVHCIYVSTATHPFESGELKKLAESACLKNDRLNVTGILVFMGGRFFQVLEGKSSVVEALFAEIERDPRHKEITRIISESIPHRDFNDWSMGMIDLSGDKIQQLATLSDPANRIFALTNLPNGRAKKLLLAFCEGRWGLTPADKGVPAIL